MKRERWDVQVRRMAIQGYETLVKQRPVFKYWHELEVSQWWPREQIAARQLERLQRLVRHAEQTAPWYKEEWAARGLAGRHVDSLEAFRAWPVIDREAVRRHRMAMRSSAPAGGLIAKATGGLTGVPLRFDLDHESHDRRLAAAYRGYEWAGAGPGTRQWYLWGTAPSSTAGWRRVKARLYDGLYRRTTASCFELSEAAVDRFLHSLVRCRADNIVAYTNALYTFARMLEARGLVPPSPTSIVVGAERLHDFQRETIERVFRAPVFETYGSREFMLIGAECEQHAGLHLTTEHLLVEILDEDGQPVPAGLEGNVVVTDLTNFGMPFIRYANGDRAVATDDECACGRGLPLLRCVAGRQLDVLTTPDGHRLPGEFFPHLLKEIESVSRFQVIQDVADAVTLKLVAPAWRPEDEAWLRREVTAAAGSSLRLDIERVADIPLTTSGKLQVVVNRLRNAPTPSEQT